MKEERKEGGRKERKKGGKKEDVTPALHSATC